MPPPNPTRAKTQEELDAILGGQQGQPHRPQQSASQAVPAEEVKLDETVEGGRYEEGGKMVDAQGKPISKSGKKSDED